MAKAAKKKQAPVPPPVTRKGMTTPLKKCETCGVALYDEKKYEVIDNFEILENTEEKEKVTEFGRVARVIYKEGEIKIRHNKCGVVIILGSGERIWDTTKTVFLKWPIFSITYENRDEILIKLYEEQEREEKRLQDEIMAKARAEEEGKQREIAEAERQKQIAHDKSVGNYSGVGTAWTEEEEKMFK